LSGVLFVVGTLSTCCLIFFNGYHAIVSVLLGALLTGCMHGVNLILVCMLPAYFKSTGSVGTVSGVFNSCTYVGSAISTYGVAYLVETYSWILALRIWMIVAVAGGLICLLCVSLWNKYKLYLDRL
jgi:OPA family glycerol-3-phosphate transporter-like MFS transporter